MQKRYILWWMFLFLLVCNTSVIISMTMAIVSMVNYSSPVNTNETTGIECPNTNLQWGKESQKNTTSGIAAPQMERFNWSEAEKNAILSGFFWLNWVVILPAGILTQKYGSKKVLGYAQCISSLLSSLVPILASDDNPQTITYIRVAQGFFSSIAVPGGLLTITGNWIPPEERGKFISVILLGSTAGLGVGSVVFGYIAEYWHWKYVFHITSSMGLVWTVLWYLLIYDSPNKHPTITEKEKNYIVNSLKDSVENMKLTIPWKEILSSFPFIVCAVATGTMAAHFVTLTTYMPTYLKAIYGLDTNQIGFITSIPQFASGFAAYSFGFMSDLIVKKEWMSVSHSRKTFAFFGGFSSAIPLAIIAFTNCNALLVIGCFIFTMVARNFNSFGVEMSIIDMSPKFCGVLQGFSGTVSAVMTTVFAGFINYLSANSSAENVWKTVFLLDGNICLAFSILFIIFGTSEIQPWNAGSKKSIKKRQSQSRIATIA